MPPGEKGTGKKKKKNTMPFKNGSLKCDRGLCDKGETKRVCRQIIEFALKRYTFEGVPFRDPKPNTRTGKGPTC
jgi:hypothetical protein